MAMRVYVFDNGLNSVNGHHGHFALHLPRSLARYDVDLRYYGHRSAPIEFPDVKIIPHFRHFHYRQYAQGTYEKLFNEITTVAKHYAADLASLKKGAPQDEDIVLVPTTGLRELLGISEWISSSGRKPRVAMLVHAALPWERNNVDLGVGTVTGLLYSMAGRAMTAAMGRERGLIAATNRYLAELIGRPLGWGVHVFPPPVWYSEIPRDEAGQERGPDRRPTISLLNQTRLDKGFMQIPSIVHRIHEQGIEATFLIHVNPEVSRLPVDLGPCEALEKEGLAQLIRGFLPDEELNALIRRSSFVLLPYDRVAYRQMMSGMFASVVAMGRPCIVPSDTWPADQIAAGKAAGVAFADDDPATIAGAVAKCLNERALHLARAEELAPAWRRERCGDALVDKWMAWAGVKRNR